MCLPRSWTKAVAVATMGISLIGSAAKPAAAADSLEVSFRSPGEEAKPWVFWYWMSGNVTREGITYDLTAMARAGIGGAYIFAIDRPGYEKYVKVDEAVRAPSDLFWERVIFAVEEAERLGLKIALNACDGWSLAGGPWITPELSMQKLVSNAIVVEGGAGAGTIRVPKPDTTISEGQWKQTAHNDYYRDIAVLAFPVAAGWQGVENGNLRPAQYLENVKAKSGMDAPRYSMSHASLWTTDANLPPQVAMPGDQVHDLTGRMDAEGKLNWVPPAGKWIVQRFGYTTTGETNRPAGKTGVGLECDKFNPAAARFQFDHWFNEAARRFGPERMGKVVSINHTDSWECGSQNWSPVFREEFIRRRGYDPVKYLPATTGIIVGSAEESERFLWDFRRTIVDLVSDSFFKTSVALTREKGALYSSETVAGTMTDSLEFYREVDIPMAEFWIASDDQGAHSIPRVVSGAHIYGKRIIQTEAFTERGIKWTEDPYFLKPLGDYSFSRGVNRFALHVWPHQAFPERVPGVTLFNVYGTVFSGNQPWHDLGRPWFDYLHRSQAMLQQGIPIADVCYFVGEELPNDAIERQELNPALPFGYDYDCINRDALLTRATAREGRLVLPDGVSYSLLVLPDSRRMTPEIAQKVGELAMAGVPVLGPRPNRTYSLVGYPTSDRRLQTIVNESWGQVIQGKTPVELLQERGVSPDVEFVGVDMAWVHRGSKVMKNHATWNGPADNRSRHRPEMAMEYSSPTFAACHRRVDHADIYFVANQEQEERTVTVAFRVAGKAPELWHPETGEIRPLTQWEERSGRTYVSLRFHPAESYFIVFRNAAPRAANGTANFALSTQVGSLDGAWTVEFQPGRGAPRQIELPALASWSEQRDEGVRHFSGIATYRRQIHASPALSDRKEGERLFLDLGRVSNVAEVTLNGKLLPAAWKPPYRVDITGLLRPGANEVSIRVANTWKNRLVADAGLSPEKRVTWTLFREQEGWFNPQKTRLEPAGLLGPVTFWKTAAP